MLNLPGCHHLFELEQEWCLMKKVNYFGRIWLMGLMFILWDLFLIFDGSTSNVSFHFNGGLNWYQSVVYLSGRGKNKKLLLFFAWSKALFFGIMLTLKPKGFMFCHLINERAQFLHFDNCSFRIIIHIVAQLSDGITWMPRLSKLCSLTFCC